MLVASVPDNGAKVRSDLVERTARLDRQSVEGASAVIDPPDRPQVSLRLTPEGGKLFEAITAALVGCRLAIMMNDRVLFAPIVQDRISGGRVTITVGGLRPEKEQEGEARSAAAAINGGILPTLHLRETRGARSAR